MRRTTQTCCTTYTALGFIGCPCCCHVQAPRLVASVETRLPQPFAAYQWHVGLAYFEPPLVGLN